MGDPPDRMWAIEKQGVAVQHARSFQFKWAEQAGLALGRHTADIRCMPQPNITREDGPSRGRYVAKLDGIDAEAELVYSRPAPTLISADHTGVPDAFRGKGIGRFLVTRMVEDARAEGVKIVARCPYVKAERQKHPEWADVFQD